MPNLLVLSFNQQRVSIAPGASGELTVSVQNLSTLLDQVALRAQGLNPDWVQIIPPTLPVFAQGQASARILISIPLDVNQAVAGLYSFTITGAMQENKGQEATTSAEIEIELTGDYQVLMEHGESVNDKDARYPLKVQNSANAPLHLRLSSSDEGGAAWYKFDPYLLKVPPASQATALVTARPKIQDETEHVIKFSLVAQGEFLPQGGAAVAAPSQQVEGQFVQVPLPKKFARVHLSIQPPTVQAQAEATYEVTVGNSGDLGTRVHLSGMDKDQALIYEFETPDNALLDLPPGKESRIKLTVHPAGPIKRQETLPFRVTATPADGAESAIAEATYVHHAPFPYTILIGAVIMLCVGWIAIVAIAWFLIRPLIH
ncbi:MAG: hypothetical protein WCF84_12160 [Anaerolineae bacterium]